jgi:hypothetical protein
LKAKGIPNDYSSDSKCDVPLEFETIGITGFGDILAGPPYPNPAGGIVQIPIKIFYTESEPDYNLFLTDTYHQQKLSPAIEDISISEIEVTVNKNSSETRNIKVASKIAKFDTHSLSNGVYFIILQTNTSKIHKIIINK